VPQVLQLADARETLQAVVAGHPPVSGPGLNSHALAEAEAERQAARDVGADGLEPPSVEAVQQAAGVQRIDVPPRTCKQGHDAVRRDAVGLAVGDQPPPRPPHDPAVLGPDPQVTGTVLQDRTHGVAAQTLLGRVAAKPRFLEVQEPRVQGAGPERAVGRRRERRATLTWERCSRHNARVSWRERSEVLGAIWRSRGCAYGRQRSRGQRGRRHVREDRHARMGSEVSDPDPPPGVGTQRRAQPVGAAALHFMEDLAAVRQDPPQPHPCGDPEAAIAALCEAEDRGRLDAGIESDGAEGPASGLRLAPEQPFVRSDPEPALRILVQGVDAPGLSPVAQRLLFAARRRRVEAAQAAPRRDPVLAVASLQEIEHRQARKAALVAEGREAIAVEAAQALLGAEPEEPVPVLDDATDLVVGEPVGRRVAPDREVLGGEARAGGEERRQGEPRGPRARRSRSALRVDGVPSSSRPARRARRPCWRRWACASRRGGRG